MFNATEYFIWSIWLVPTNKRLPQNGRTSFPRGEAANLSLARGLSHCSIIFISVATHRIAADDDCQCIVDLQYVLYCTAVVLYTIIKAVKPSVEGAAPYSTLGLLLLRPYIFFHCDNRGSSAARRHVTT